MSNRRGTAVAVLMAGCAAAAIACGPFFPWQLLDDRAQTLKATPVNSFGFEASHLTPAPKDTLKPVETSVYAWYSQANGQLAENASLELSNAEAAGLTRDQVVRLRTAREAASGPEALEMSKGLPPAIAAYTAGAVAWHKSDYAFAKTQFEAVLNLRGKERSARAVWAAYMLGRVGTATGDSATARKGFALTRQYAERGAPDPLGLAVASYGGEARLHLHAAEALLEGTGATAASSDTDRIAPDSEAKKYAGRALPDRSVATFRSEMAQTIRLYAEQAARGSDSGVQSLRIVAEFLLDRTDRIQAVAREPLPQRLMVAYALRLTPNNSVDIASYGGGNTIAYYTQIAQSRQQQALSDLVAALKPIAHPAGADRIAALCYSLADWKCATDFAAKAQSPLADWVRAKLATQKGNLAEAAKFYASAVHGFPTTNALDETGRKQLIGEAGVIALARGEYVDALTKLWPVSGTYWPDVAFLAERVLTVDELKTFVDAHVPPGKAPAVDGKPAPYGMPFDSRVTLRDLLARRLMRAGRHDEAFTYFSDPTVLEAAKSYAAALDKAKNTWTWGKVDKAEALFEAATIARQHGMEIMGTEGPPDEYYTGGDFEAGLGRNALKGPFITPGEKARFAASNAVPDQRFHYRYVATDLASQAAWLVPARSQAYAAMLCHATAWSSRDEKRAKQFWQRYVKEGARVPFAKTFGETCPAPDFKGAITMERKIMVREARAYVSRNRWWFAGGGGAGVLILAGLVAFLVLRRKRNAT